MKKILSLLLCFGIFIGYTAPNVFAENETGLSISAKACILMDADSGRVLYAENENEKLYPASVTKIMALLLVCESLDNGTIKLTDNVTASAQAASKGGSQIWLKEGETMTVDNLLKAVAIGSANDACCALGEYLTGSEAAFVEKMNTRAKELGMKNTHFDNCTGLDDDTDTHKSTAYDIALMSRELLKHEIIEKYSTVWMDSLRDGKTQLVNTNRLVRFYNGTTGLKTGTTQKAGKCLSASARRDNLHLVAVVLGCEDSNKRFEDAKALLDYGFSTYESAVIETDEGLIAPVRVIKGKKEAVIPKLTDGGTVIVKKGEKDKISAEITLSKDVEAPVEKGQKLGSVAYYIGESLICERTIYSPEAIERLTFPDTLKFLFLSLTKL